MRLYNGCMASAFKAPKVSKSNVYLIASGKEAGRYRWDVRITRKDGSEFRKAGTKATEKEAIAARDEAFAKFNQSGGKGGRVYTVQTWCEYCLSGGMTEQNARTLHSYKHWLTTRVYPVIGRIKLDELRVDGLQLFYQELQASDVPSSAVRTRTALNACLTRAVEEGVLDRHLGRIAKLKKTRRNVEDDEDEGPSKRILSTDEQKSLVEFSRGTMLYWPVILGLKFGLRAGECLGLKWSDFDFEKREVKIRRQSQNLPGEGVAFTPLKTKNSARTLPIPSTVFEELQRGAEKAREANQELVCPNNLGNKYTPQNLSTPFKQIAKKAGINKSGLTDCTHHDLRSTFLTFLANHADNGRGVRPATLLAIAGHSKIETTFRYYVFANNVDMRQAMEFVS